jgi:formylglycine-generating enzyme
MLLLTAAFAQITRAQDLGQGQPREIVNSIGMKLVLIPANEFLMGGQESADDLVRAFPAYNRKPAEFSDEYPRHRVRITRPFYLGRYEVTVGNFRRFVDDTGYKTAAETDGQGGWGYNPATGHCEGRRIQYNWRNPGFPQTDDHPVLNVTWNDAVAFCRWLSRREGNTYRLPTEAEWEYACRAGTTTRYSSGDDPTALAKVAKVASDKGRTEFPAVQNVAISPDEKGRFTVPVGSFLPNGFGLYDMHGNAWEWCADWYAQDYYSRSPTDDPQGPASGKRRVRRGGAWNSFPLWPRSAFRNWNKPNSRCANLGMRVARDTETRFGSGNAQSPSQSCSKVTRSCQHADR